MSADLKLPLPLDKVADRIREVVRQHPFDGKIDVQMVKVEGEDPPALIEIGQMVYIDEQPTTMRTLAGEAPALGYRVFVVKSSPGGRWHPPESWDHTVGEVTRDVRAAIKLALHTLVGEAVEIVMMSPDPDDEARWTGGCDWPAG